MMSVQNVPTDSNVFETLSIQGFHITPPQGAAATSAQMGLANIGGVFIVLLGGMIFSCIIAVVEYAWGKRMLLQDENVRTLMIMPLSLLQYCVSIISCLVLPQGSVHPARVDA